MGTPLTKQWNQNYGCSESKLRSCSLRRFNLARQDLQNTFATVSAEADMAQMETRLTEATGEWRHMFGCHVVLLTAVTARTAGRGSIVIRLSAPCDRKGHERCPAAVCP
jgi:hypothetical protein